MIIALSSRCHRYFTLTWYRFSRVYRARRLPRYAPKFQSRTRSRFVARSIRTLVNDARQQPARYAGRRRHGLKEHYLAIRLKYFHFSDISRMVSSR